MTELTDNYYISNSLKTNNMTKLNIETPTGKEKKPSTAQGCLAVVSFAIGLGLIIYAVYVFLS